MTIVATKPQPAAKPSTAPLFTGQSTTGPGVASHDDFVADVVRIIASVAASVSTDHLRAIDAKIREEWGGDRPYIGRRHGDVRNERNDQIRRDVRHGASINLVCRRYDVSRSTVYRVLGIDGE
jgi:Mor family transcriptional regulator